MFYYLAIDIGASSGRHILGSFCNGKLKLEEIYRFENRIVSENGCLAWDVDMLFYHVVEGIKKCGELGKIPGTVAIDTWGVDYVLLDADKKEIYPAMCYRDKSTYDAEKAVSEFLPQDKLYKITGIAKQPFNTLYQLYRDNKNGKLKNAEYMLMIPEYLSFKLTGKIMHEYTNASTTGLLNAQDKTWDKEIIKKAGLPEKLFGELSLPGTEVGCFTDEVQKKAGYNATVVFCPSHDTASAVAACPVDEESIYISSGTWSLMGTENITPILTKEAQSTNLTNEGGIEYRYRFLKNITGMWLFQNMRKETGRSYGEMMELAKSSSFTATVDPGAQELSAPVSMAAAVRELLKMPELPLEDLLSALYHSLALSYKQTVEEIAAITGKRFKCICIVGGGSKDSYLNSLTAKYTGLPVYTGITEATAAGNLMTQIMHEHKLTLAEAREIIKNSFEVKEEI